jgi:hypothetical protein
VLLLKSAGFKDLLYNFFSGQYPESLKQDYKGKFFIDDEDITGNPLEKDFIYLCHPNDIPPGMKVGHLVKLVLGLMGLKPGEIKTYYKQYGITSIAGLKFNRLDEIRQIEIMLSFLQVRKRQNYLIYYITREMPIDCYFILKDVMEELSQQGALVLYLTRDRLISIPHSMGLDKDYIDYSELLRWSEVVENHREQGGV